MRNLETDVLVVGAGGAGMYAAVEAARLGSRVILADRGLIGRSGATVMAQMTVGASSTDAVPFCTATPVTRPPSWCRPVTRVFRRMSPPALRTPSAIASINAPMPPAGYQKPVGACCSSRSLRARSAEMTSSGQPSTFSRTCR